jgi:hypothetical protein
MTVVLWEKFLCNGIIVTPIAKTPDPLHLGDPMSISVTPILSENLVKAITKHCLYPEIPYFS